MVPLYYCCLHFSPVKHTHISVQSSYKANIPRHLIVPSSKLTIGTSIGQGEHTSVLSTCKFFQYLVQNITFRGKLPIGVGSGGARGRLAPPSFKLGGHRPPNFTHCLHNELHCSIVDRIACSSRNSHFLLFKKNVTPQVRTSSYAYVTSELAMDWLHDDP